MNHGLPESGLIRTFIAVEVPRELIPGRVFDRLEEIRGSRTVRTETLHVTIHFFGEIRPSFIERIKESLDRVKFSYFSLRFHGIGAFPSPAKARVVHLPVADPDRIKDVREAILRGIGLNLDGEFVPHLTLARMRNPVSVLPLVDSFSQLEITTPVREINLFSSRLTSSGPEYRVLKRVPLDKS